LIARRGPWVEDTRAVVRSDVRVLFRSRRAYLWRETPAACASSFKVPPCLSQAEMAVRAASALVRIVVILTVVLPEADWTDLVHCTLSEGNEAAARAAIRTVLGSAYDIREHHERIVLCDRADPPAIFVRPVESQWARRVNTSAILKAVVAAMSPWVHIPHPLQVNGP
jgi:hypothetical protein